MTAREAVMWACFAGAALGFAYLVWLALTSPPLEELERHEPPPAPPDVYICPRCGGPTRAWVRPSCADGHPLTPMLLMDGSRIVETEREAWEAIANNPKETT